VGTLVLETGERRQRFEESYLNVTFDENSDLPDVNGEPLLPPSLTDNVVVDTPARAIANLMTATEWSTVNQKGSQAGFFHLMRRIRITPISITCFGLPLSA